MKKSNRISKQHNFMQVVTYSLIGCMFLTSLISVVLADANPPPGTLPSGVLGVPEGSVGSFDYSPGRLDIKDVAHQTVINWNNFDIGSGATTQFHQLGGPSSAVMNRIYDGSPTGIYGSLLGNGRVFIINPAGVIFGAGSTVNVNQLVASSLKMTDRDFLNATNVVNPLDMKFELSGDGVVENYGVITAADSVYLVGKNVLNAGTIISPGGLVVLAAGEEVWLAQPGSDVVVKKLAAPSQQDHTVINSGTIEAAGGEIILAAGDVFSNAVDLPVAGGVGKVGQFGILDADGVDGDGGSINMTAGEVVALSSDSLTTANAGENGDGGEVIVYSPGAVLFWEGARIEAKGGSESGDGGFIEISGKQNIEIWGLVDTTAPYGATGIFLIDPYNLSIVTGTAGTTGWSGGNPDAWTSTNTLNQLGVTTLLSHLDSSNVIVQTGSGSNGQGDITVDAAINYSNLTYNNLTLRAHDDITINQPITAGTHNLTLEADVGGSNRNGDVFLNAALSSTTGNITASGEIFTSNSSGTIATTGGDVTLNFDRDINLNAAVSSTTGNIGLYANLSNNNYNINVNSGGISSTTGNITLDVDAGNKGGDVILGAAVGTTTGDVSAYGDNFNSTGSGTITTTGGSVLLDFDDNITLGGVATLNSGGELNLDARNNVSVNAAINSTGGNVIMTAGSDSGDDEIDIQAPINISGGGTLTLTANGSGDNDIRIRNPITMGNGDLTATSDDDISLGYNSSTGGITVNGNGNVSLDADDNIEVTSTSSGIALNGNGNISLDAGGDVTVNAPISSNKGDISASGENFTSNSGGSITTTGTSAGEGDVTFNFDEDITTNALITLNSGHLEMLGGQSSGDDDIHINESITAGSMRIKNGRDTSGESSNSAINLANGKTLQATTGDVIIETVHDIVLGGDVSAFGHIFINGDENGYGNPLTGPYNPTHYGGGDVTTSNLTAGGNVEVKGNDIQFNGDVSANGGDLNITGRTSRDFDTGWGDIDVAAGKTLYASGNVNIDDLSNPGGQPMMTLTGHTWLMIEAENGIISAPDTVIQVLGSELILEQGLTLNTANLLFDNQANTHLTLISNKGSVISTDVETAVGKPFDGDDDNAADQWKSIGATANGGIILSGHENDIQARRLQAAHGPIEVDAKGHDILANDHGFTGDDGILASGGGNITLKGLNVTVDGDIDAQHGSGIRPVGYNSDLTIEADDSIELKGNVDVDGDIDLLASLSSGPGETIYLGGDHVVAAGNVFLNDNTELNGGISQKIEATTGTLTAMKDVDKTTDGDLNLNGGSGIYLAGNVTTLKGNLTFENNVEANGDSDQRLDAGTKWNSWGNALIAQGDIDKTTDGSLTLDGGRDDSEIQLAGNVTTHDGDLIFEDRVVANGGDQRLDAGTTWHSGGNALIAQEDIDKTTDGSLTLDGGRGDSEIQLAGNVTTHDGDLIFEDRVVANGDGAQRLDAGTTWHSGGNALIAQEDIDKTTDGSLTLDGGRDDSEIQLAGNVTTHDGDLIFEDRVVANGDSDQRLDAGTTWHSGGNALIAQEDIDKTTAGNLNLDAGRGDSEIHLAGDVTTLNGNLTFEDRVIADGSGNQRFDAGTVWASAGNILTAQEDISKTTAGNLNLDAGRGDSEIQLAGNVTTSNGNLIFEDRVIANGSGSPKDQRFAADGKNKDLVAEESIDKITSGNLTLGAGWGSGAFIYLAGNVTTHDGDLTFEDNVIANGDGDQRFDAGTTWHSWGNALIAEGDISKMTNGSLTLDGGRGDSEIRLAGDVTTHDGDLTFEDDVIANGIGYFGHGRNQTFQANGFGKVLHAEETITKETRGDLTLAGGYYADSGYEIDLDGNVEVQNGDLILGNWSFFFADDDVIVAPDCTLQASDDVKVYDDLNGEGDLTVLAGDDIELHGDVTAAGNLNLSTGSKKTIYLWGDATAYYNIWFGSNVEFEGWDDQTVWAQNGSITADGYLNKLNSQWMWWSDGSLYLHAYGDISLADDVTAAICYPKMCWCAGGGVSIISDTGSIFTPGFYVDIDGVEKPALAIDITGRSDHFGYWGPIGVVLPGEDTENPEGLGWAAIVIMSAEDLVLHEWSDLLACGTYYAEGVDDRPYVNFLDMPGESIGGSVRDEGDAFDAAIYVASTGADTDDSRCNIHLGGEVDIMSRELVPYNDGLDGLDGLDGHGKGEWQCVRRGAMIADAYDTVTFGEKFKGALADGRVGDRLEVCSRITEWLQDAVGRLPFPGDLTLPGGYNYVMRGAGLENIAITDGRAWVLENKPVSSSAAPIGGLLMLGVENAGLGGGGCPALMTWLSDELGVNEEELQVYLENAFVYSTDCQPCELAAKLKDLAVILEDPEGVGIAALAQVISEFLTTPAPPSEEEMAAIAEQLASHIGDDTYYAAAEQWIDALVAYVGILTDEMGWPADKAVTFVMENYGSPVTDSGNAALVAYVQARLAASGGGVL